MWNSRKSCSGTNLKAKQVQDNGFRETRVHCGETGPLRENACSGSQRHEKSLDPKSLIESIVDQDREQAYCNLPNVLCYSIT